MQKFSILTVLPLITNYNIFRRFTIFVDTFSYANLFLIYNVYEVDFFDLFREMVVPYSYQI